MIDWGWLVAFYLYAVTAVALFGISAVVKPHEVAARWLLALGWPIVLPLFALFSKGAR